MFYVEDFLVSHSVYVEKSLDLKIQEERCFLKFVRS